MNIIKAEKSDFVEVWYLLEVHSREMRKKGWIIPDFNFDLIKTEVFTGNAWVFRNKENVCLGTLIFSSLFPDHNPPVPFQSQHPLFVQNLVVHPEGKNMDVLTHLLSFAEEFAKTNGYTSICFDIFSKNQALIDFCNQQKYQQKGDFLIDDQKIPFYSFEKMLH